MARRPTNVGRRGTAQEMVPDLTVPRSQLDEELADRIAKGNELLEIPVRAGPELEQARGKYYTWHDYNEMLIKRSFTTSAPALTYAEQLRFVFGGGLSLEEEYNDFHEDVTARLRRLESLREQLPLFAEAPNVAGPAPARAVAGPTGTQVFIVHGHSEAVKQSVVRTVQRLTGVEPVILHEQPDRGRTIIEKFEGEAADIGFAIILLTGDDEGRSRLGDPAPELQLRARQNVVFEMGYFIGRLGRPYVAILYEDDVELPSDISGLLYTPLANWELKLAQEMRAAGLNVDLNHL